MANIKFSAFTQKVVTGNVDFLVGYTGADNVRISPAIFSDTYLPLAGGTMIGNTINTPGTEVRFGNSGEMGLFFSSAVSNIRINSGVLAIRADDMRLSNQDRSENYITAVVNGAVELYYDGVKKFETEASGVLITSGSYCSWGTSGVTSIEGSTVSNKIAFRTLSTERMRIDSTGNVGIGTDAPSYTLEVDGTATVATDPTYIVAKAGIFEMAIGSRNAPGVAQEAFVGTLGSTDFKIKTNSVDIGRFTQTKKFVIGRDSNPASTIEAFTGGNTVHAAMLLQHDSFAAGRLCGIGFELGSTQIKAAIAVKADAAAIGTHGRSNIIFCVDSVDDANPVSHNDEKMRITHTGDVGIGIIPLAKFQVKCDTNVNFTTSENAGNLRINAVNDAVAATVGLEFNASDYEFLGTGASTFGGDVIIDDGVGRITLSSVVGDNRIQSTTTGFAAYEKLTFTADDYQFALGDATFAGNVNIADSKKLNFGASSDLQIYHDGVNSYIEDLGTGNMYIQFYERLRFQDSTGGGGTIAAFNVDSSGCQLYYIGALKLQTTNTGTVVTGQMDIAALNAAPANAGDTGTLGEIRYTADYIYVCVAADTWKRTAITTW